MSGPDWSYYAKQRQHLRYYQVVRDYVSAHSPGESILDVGAGGTDIVLTGDYQRRTIVNREPLNVSRYPGTEVIIADWMGATVGPHEVVCCCQVLEHLTDEQVAPFVDKLRATATKALIVSVPFLWPAGICKYHPQDPIDYAKFVRMVGGEPDRYEVVIDDRHGRLVAEYLL